MRIPAEILKKSYPKPDRVFNRENLIRAQNEFKKCMIVLDDDPTGTQTVHDVQVLTKPTEASIYDMLASEVRLFYVLTNSRSFSEEKTQSYHKDLIRTIDRAARRAKREYIIISRADSTLRGHYPLECDVICDTWARENGYPIDAEILMPYFKEGGRCTANSVHYVLQDQMYVPCGETEFAADKTFGYKSSNLKEYIEEKTNGRVPADEVKCVTIRDLRYEKPEKVFSMLMALKDHDHLVVDALEISDVEVFAAAVIMAMNRGKHFLFRCAASLVKVLGGIEERTLLKRDEMVGNGSANGGLILIGSHTEKTTNQLNVLLQNENVIVEHFNPLWAIIPNGVNEEIERIAKSTKQSLLKGSTVVICTPRQLLTLNATPADDLRLSVAISGMLVSVLQAIDVCPRYVIAKGGITSADTATKGLKIECAKVLGQILPGIPVWQCGNETRFPGIPYVIFPGNVGDSDSLRKIVHELDG